VLWFVVVGIGCSLDFCSILRCTVVCTAQQAYNNNTSMNQMSNNDVHHKRTNSVTQQRRHPTTHIIMIQHSEIKRFVSNCQLCCFVSAPLTVRQFCTFTPRLPVSIAGTPAEFLQCNPLHSSLPHSGHARHNRQSSHDTHEIRHASHCIPRSTSQTGYYNARHITLRSHHAHAVTALAPLTAGHSSFYSASSSTSPSLRLSLTFTAAFCWRYLALLPNIPRFVVPSMIRHFPVFMRWPRLLEIRVCPASGTLRHQLLKMRRRRRRPAAFV
jgi:hypothetical protein